MSLYHEAAEILTKTQKEGGSLKSIVFGKKTWKSDAKTLFALATEAAKWSDVLSEVVEKSGILKVEKILTPTLALLLTHDLFLAKKGIALPATHGLNTAVSRHKVRISAELTRARLRRGFATLDALREHVNAEAASGQDQHSNGPDAIRHPRWIRINTLKSSLDDELSATFSNYTIVKSLKEITHATAGSRLVHVDEHVPNLIAVAGSDDPTTFKSYKQGKLILQEKASCFPAYLLNPIPGGCDVIDACAAPGNKTTHLAAILGDASRVIACEKDAERSKTLQRMVKIAGADSIVEVKQKQNFLKLDPAAPEFSNITALLLDPSCSGSGIFGRDEAIIKVHLPSMSTEESHLKSKKRKRGGQQQKQSTEPESTKEEIVEEMPENESNDTSKLKARLENLSTFQLRLLQHAMSFPAARTITYSTCSMHDEENEHVVVKALTSEIAQQQGWRVMKRSEQVEGMQKWHKRGVESGVRDALAACEVSKDDAEVVEIADACIRCEKGGQDGTMGFFVCGFTKDLRTATATTNGKSAKAANEVMTTSAEDEEEWNGFGEDET
ncbi:NOL1 NOP2 sun domain [Lecanosticta acicola]|uniref:NOL1 NOP2 sun domain n=1 Tax=Lecanosticta acicola TaxID=111012 RepID=A0AAI9E3U2_9PEZI|nr:NOL1 NOP2 sun domain [Lecanosticta acicola]